MARTKQTSRRAAGPQQPLNVRTKRKRETTDRLDLNTKRAKLSFDINTVDWEKFLNSSHAYATAGRGYDFVDFDIPTKLHGESLLTILNNLDLSKIYGEKFLSFTPEKTENLQKQLQFGKYSEDYFPEDEEDEEEEVNDDDEFILRDRAIVFDYQNWELGYICATSNYSEIIYLFDYKNLDYVIVGIDSCHPFIHCNEFDYGNSDGSSPSLIEQEKITPTFLLDKMQYYYRSFCNNRYY